MEGASVWTSAFWPAEPSHQELAMSRFPIPATIEDAPAASRTLLEAVKKQIDTMIKAHHGD